MTWMEELKSLTLGWLSSKRVRRWITAIVFFLISGIPAFLIAMSFLMKEEDGRQQSNGGLGVGSVVSIGLLVLVIFFGVRVLRSKSNYLDLLDLDWIRDWIRTPFQWIWEVVSTSLTTIIGLTLLNRAVFWFFPDSWWSWWKNKEAFWGFHIGIMMIFIFAVSRMRGRKTLIWMVVILMAIMGSKIFLQTTFGKAVVSEITTEKKRVMKQPVPPLPVVKEGVLIVKPWKIAGLTAKMRTTGEYSIRVRNFSSEGGRLRFDFWNPKYGKVGEAELAVQEDGGFLGTFFQSHVSPASGEICLRPVPGKDRFEGWSIWPESLGNRVPVELRP